jgi:hypothetical protein
MDIGSIAGTLVGQLVLAGAIYGGIRADLRNLKEQTARIQAESDRAHARIDQFVMRESRQ